MTIGGGHFGWLSAECDGGWGGCDSVSVKLFPPRLFRSLYAIISSKSKREVLQWQDQS
jgi:hypothetical protein